MFTFKTTDSNHLQKYKPRGKWFNNGLDLKMFYDGQEIPSGWSKGRLKTRKVVIHV
jgi:hypothetical protein